MRPEATEVMAMPDEVQPPDQAPEGAAPGGEQCWYCRSAAAEQARAAEASLYADVRISDVQTTVTGYNVTKTWKVLKVPIPRCRRCAGAHAVRGYIVAGFALPLGLAAIGAAIWNHAEFDSVLVMAFVALIGGFAAACLGALAGWLLGRLVTPWSIPDAGHSREYPAVRALLAQGWKLGSKPGAGEEYRNR